VLDAIDDLLISIAGKLKHEPVFNTLKSLENFIGDFLKKATLKA